MTILWLIIKIILIVLLALLGVGVFLLGVVLYAPICYEAYFAKYDELSYDIQFKYLGGIKGCFYQEKDKKNHKISLFGKVIYKNEVKEELTDTEPLEKGQPSPKKEIVYNKKQIDIQPNSSLGKQEKEIKLVKSKAANQSIDTNEKLFKVEKEVNPGLKQEIKEDVEDLAEKAVDETVETVKKMPYNWAKKLVFDKNTYGAIRQVILCIWRILKEIFPYEWSFEIVIGKEDPADTGETIAKLTMLYPMYYRHGIIRGNYEKECLEGGFLAKGRFTLGGILWHMLKCIFSKQVRILMKFIFRIRKEEDNGK